MKVFITGGSGYIGSAVTKELIAHGHEVVGIARSEKSKQSLAELGAVAIDGSLEDLDSLKRGAESADAVIHTAFIHNFAEFAACCETDRQAIEALGNALVGTNKPFIVTSGVPSGNNDRNPAGREIATENTIPDSRFPRVSEQTALLFAEKDVRVSIVRPSRFVHGDGIYGFATQLINIARDKGFSAYVGDGANHLHAVHRADLVVLYRLALEKGENGARYQGVGDFAVTFRNIAEAIATRLNVPATSISAEKAAEYFGMLSQILTSENPASSEITQNALGWKPTHISLVEDLAHE